MEKRKWPLALCGGGGQGISWAFDKLKWDIPQEILWFISSISLLAIIVGGIFILKDFASAFKEQKQSSKKRKKLLMACGVIFFIVAIGVSVNVFTRLSKPKEAITLLYLFGHEHNGSLS